MAKTKKRTKPKSKPKSKPKTKAESKAKVNYGHRQAVYFAEQDRSVLTWSKDYAKQRKVGFSRIVVEALMAMRVATGEAKVDFQPGQQP